MIYGKQIVISCLIAFYYNKIVFRYDASRINIDNANDQCSERNKVYSLLAGPMPKESYGQKENSKSKVCCLI